MTVAYVWAKPSKYMDLLQIRNNIHNVVDNDHYYRKQKPHITLIPPFKIEDDAEQEIENQVDSYDLDGTKVVTNNLTVHKNIKEPYAVYIKVELEKQKKIHELRGSLAPHSAVSINRGKDPHISLLKTRGWWDEVPQDLSQRLSNEIKYTHITDELAIDRIRVDFER